MKSKPFASCLVFLPILFLSKESSGDELPLDFSVPIIAIDVERAVDAEEVEEVIRGLNSPVIRGKALVERAELVPSLDADFTKVVQRLFTQAQDNFFSGKHQQAELDFAEIIDKASANHINRLTPRHLREIVFKSHIQLAVMAHESGDEKRMEEQLQSAFEKFSDLETISREFPPWVCRRYDSIRDVMKPKLDDIFVETSGVVRSKLLLRSQDLTIVADDGSRMRPLVRDALALARRGAWTRLIAVVGKIDSMEVWLVDTDFNGVIRKNSIPRDDIGAASRAAEALLEEQSQNGMELREEKRPWYKDGLAWTMVGVGGALLAGGLALGQVYGTPSQIEPWAYALIAAGGGAIGTGAVLFFIQPFSSRSGIDSKEKNIAIGAAAGIKF
jgi:hypothetical protein